MDVEEIIVDIVSKDLPLPRLREGLGVVQKLLANIKANPNQEKFRQVKKTNPAIQARLFPQCFDILRAAGFQDVGDLLVFQAEPHDALSEALDLVSSLLMSLGEAPAPAATNQTSAAKTQVSPPSAAQSSRPKESKRSQLERQEKAKAEIRQSEAASASDQLAALRRNRANQYQTQQDVALAQHLSGRAAEEPYDAISALNQSRGATTSIVTCKRCGSSLRYSLSSRAKAVLCPCGMLLQPAHMQGQVDAENRPRGTRGPFITVRGPNGELTRLPLHSVLQMVRQHEERQQSGARDETIEALPTRRFEAGSATASAADGGGSDEDHKCQICMEDFTEGDELRTLPCFHLFHAACVDQWLKVNSICPTCRHKVG
eukprot:TRINITY_DN38957_c0_g1_i1.p1 TRINITY_DN38957_c0_g1~~TRINITY_DN38957_c0_g1_i1.p1  ORF type:complete len:373 (-),score=71.02 TRINITY_DN38957_c0_g1_i1:111-1229(-)